MVRADCFRPAEQRDAQQNGRTHAMRQTTRRKDACDASNNQANAMRGNSGETHAMCGNSERRMRCVKKPIDK